MRAEIKGLDGRRLLRSLAKTLAAGAAMYVVARGGLLLVGAGSGFLERALVVSTVGAAALAAYLGVALLLKTEELSSTRALFGPRAKRRVE
jgi:hypothetical protein